MTDIEAIEIFNRKLNAAQAVLDSGFGEHPGESATMYHRNKALYKVAISALQERIERERNEPLTLDELRKMDGEPVWVTPLGFWALVISKRGERVKLICNDGETVWADKEIELVGPVYRHRPAMPGEEV